MRSFSKKLAFVLAAAMVVTTFAPAASAKAADDMAINKSSQILYVNEGKNHKGAPGVAEGKGNVSEYDFYVKNKPEDWKKTLKFEWTSSDEKVATVNKSGLTTAVGVGKATISCKITKDGEVVTTAKTKVTVKANADAVEIKNPEVAAVTYEVGKTVDLDRVMYDEDGNKTTKRGTLVTDYTEWLCDKEDGVEITQSNGKYTFTKAGEYTVWCRTYQSSKYTKTTAESDKIKITVVDKNFKMSQQLTSKKFVLTFGQPVDIKLAQVQVFQKVSALLGPEEPEFIVRDVVMSADKMSATVELFRDLQHGAEYKVTVTGYNDGSFTASVGNPVRMELYVGNDVNNKKVNVGVATDLKYRLYDAKDVDVTEHFENNHLSAVEYSIEYSAGYTAYDSYVLFDQAGESAVVEATYYPGESYDNAAEEIGVFKSEKTPFVALAATDKSIVGIDSWGVNGNAKDVKLDDDRDPDGQLWLKLKFSDNTVSDTINAYGQDIYCGDKYIGFANFTAINPDYVDIYEESTQVDVYGHQVGKGSIMFSYVTNRNGEYTDVPVQSLLVNVLAKRYMDKVYYNTPSLTLSADPADNENSPKIENPVIKLEVKDQYGDTYNAFAAVDWETKSAIAKDATDSRTVGDETDHGVVVDMTDLENITINNGEATGLLWMTTNNLGQIEKVKTEKDDVSVAYTVEVVDGNNADNKKFAKFTVNFRGHKGNETHDNMVTSGHTMEVAVYKTDLDKRQNNIARTEGSGNNAYLSALKTYSFELFEKCNLAYYDEMKFEAWTSASTSVPASDGLYFKVWKGSKDVTQKAITLGNLKVDQFDGDANNANGSGSKATYAFSGETESTFDPARKIVSYKGDTIGAGTYKFQIYNVKGGKATTIKDGLKTVVVKAETGTYRWTFRDKITVADTSAKSLLSCFKIKDASQAEINFNTITDDLNGETGTVKFGNSAARDFMIIRNYDKEAATNGENVFVEKIVFWEKVGTTADGSEDLFAEFVVPINFFVEIAH